MALFIGILLLQLLNSQMIIKRRQLNQRKIVHSYF